MANNIQAVIQKILADESFRKELLRNPENTLQQNGVTPTPDIVSAFKGLDEEGLKELASNYSADKAAC